MTNWELWIKVIIFVFVAILLIVEIFPIWPGIGIWEIVIKIVILVLVIIIIIREWRQRRQPPKIGG